MPALLLPVTALEWRLHVLLEHAQRLCRLAVMLGLSQAGLRLILQPPFDPGGALTPLIFALLALCALLAAATADVFLIGRAARREPPEPHAVTHAIDLARWSRIAPEPIAN
ncbi:MAG: hypothetical protein EOM91_10375 [Sphingobacteriia bacterium]|nr:hypothetical protein [Sphingobacteriia bacterium]